MQSIRVIDHKNRNQTRTSNYKSIRTKPESRNPNRPTIWVIGFGSIFGFQVQSAPPLYRQPVAPEFGVVLAQPEQVAHGDRDGQGSICSSFTVCPLGRRKPKADQNACAKGQPKMMC
jgi:hypothetical protein